MKKEIAEKWIKALRSGEYEQGQGCLSEGGKYCCLGVLCEILNVPKTIDEGTMTARYSGYTLGLPVEVRELSGISSLDGVLPRQYVVGFEVVQTLAGLNDIGMSFNEIADIIEKEWENL